MNPTAAEKESRKVAKLIVWLANEEDRGEVEGYIHEAADNSYGNPSKLHELTRILCTMCRGTAEDVIYNGRSKKARKLADWWDNHLEGEQRRRKEDEEVAEQEHIAQKALKKLSKKERKALGLSG
jgi:hypothetical protein